MITKVPRKDGRLDAPTHTDSTATEIERLKRENAGLLDRLIDARRDDVRDETADAYERSLVKSRDAWKTPSAEGSYKLDDGSIVINGVLTSGASGPATPAQVEDADPIEAARRRMVERNRTAAR